MRIRLRSDCESWTRKLGARLPVGAATKLAGLLVCLLLANFVASASWASDGGLRLLHASLESVPQVPLAAILLVETNVPARVAVSTSGWSHQFQTYDTQHALPLLGFAPGGSYELTLNLEGWNGESLVVPEVLVLETPSLPADFPPLKVLASEPTLMEPGHTLLGVRNREAGGSHYTMALDAAGTVVWYLPLWVADLRQLSNGNLLFGSQSTAIVEIDNLGQTVRSWHPKGVNDPLPGSIPVDTLTFHHEAYPTERGSILTLSRGQRTVDGYPTSYTDPESTATASSDDDVVVEFDAESGAVLAAWSLQDILDPTRIGYDSLAPGYVGAYDWGHANAVIDVPSDDAVIVSLRHQDAIVKFSRTNGGLHWILGTHDNWKPAFLPFLLAPSGLPFEWQFHQHAPMLTPQGTLLLFDNGNARESPFHGPPMPLATSYSRAWEVSIDPGAMAVTQVWEYGTTIEPHLYASFVSDADWLPETGNVLITFGGLQQVGGQPTNGTAIRVVEVTRDVPAQEVFALAVEAPAPGTAGWMAYRSERISRLYPPPLELMLAVESGSPLALGLAVTFFATATGGSGRHELEFWLRRPGEKWQLAQPYGTETTFTWDPPHSGAWEIQARARDLGSSALAAALAEISVEIPLFADGFESGDLTAWSHSTSP